VGQLQAGAAAPDRQRPAGSAIHYQHDIFHSQISIALHEAVVQENVKIGLP